ncbi:hypothetical protein [Caenispirillum salinarum]|uniref:hypothetical protein n=1 Tax=Caenispirillum salinarum TaxID=859058 RepID=UPI00384BE5BB
MKMLSALAAAAIIVPGVAFAQSDIDTMQAGSYARGVGDWELRLSGTGASDKDFETTSFGVSGTVGQYLYPGVLVGIQQDVAFADTDDDNQLNASTRIFGQYVFDLGQWQPYVGAAIGGTYGEDVNSTFTAGPQLGVKYYADRNTFIYVGTEYQFAFEDSDEIDDAFDDGSFYHTLGVGFNF